MYNIFTMKKARRLINAEPGIEKRYGFGLKEGVKLESNQCIGVIVLNSLQYYAVVIFNG